jgi:acyl carrier protein
MTIFTMDKNQINEIVFNVINEFLSSNDIKVEGKINKDTALIGSARILDSMGLVNVIVDIETAFLDEDVEISLTSEAAMSGRISPFRSVGSLCNFIARQLGIEEE